MDEGKRLVSQLEGHPIADAMLESCQRGGSLDEQG